MKGKNLFNCVSNTIKAVLITGIVNGIEKERFKSIRSSNHFAEADTHVQQHLQSDFAGRRIDGLNIEGIETNDRNHIPLYTTTTAYCYYLCIYQVCLLGFYARNGLAKI